MKKGLLIFAMVMLAGSYMANAQIQRGNVLVGGDIANFQLQLNKGGYFNVQIDPKAAWFIRDNVAVGGYLNLALATAKNSGTSVSYGVGALARYYTGAAQGPATHTRLFVEGNVGIEGLNPGGTADNTNGLGIGIGPGIAYFVTPNIGLEALLKYNGIIGFGTTPKSDVLRLGLGFQIYLPGRTVRAAAAGIK